MVVANRLTVQVSLCNVIPLNLRAVRCHFDICTLRKGAEATKGWRVHRRTHKSEHEKALSLAQGADVHSMCMIDTSYTQFVTGQICVARAVKNTQRGGAYLQELCQRHDHLVRCGGDEFFSLGLDKGKPLVHLLFNQVQDVLPCLLRHCRREAGCCPGVYQGSPPQLVWGKVHHTTT
jgi:hypothetical protein